MERKMNKNVKNNNKKDEKQKDTKEMWKNVKDNGMR